MYVHLGSGGKCMPKAEAKNNHNYSWSKEGEQVCEVKMQQKKGDNNRQF